MCLALQLQVKRIEHGLAVMETGRKVRLDLVKDARVGEYLEVYADMALQRVDAADALSQRQLIKKKK